MAEADRPPPRGGGDSLAARTPALATDGVSKEYGRTTVLSQMTLDILAGEIHALCGENGAGKSTLVNILGGIVRPDGGTILFEDSPVALTGPLQARELGIAVIHQHPILFPDLTIAENIALANPQGRGRFWMRHGEARTAAAEVLRDLGVQLDPGRNASTLAIADQQMVEIAKALAQSPKVLILDEPTASLTPHEVDRLFTILHDLRGRGVALLIINHRMSEVFAISDRITVLRNGVRVATSKTDEVTPEQVVQQMVGREVRAQRTTTVAQRDAGLETIDLTRRGVFTNISLTVHFGEVVGLAGLIGAGRTDIARAIFGLDSVDGGEIRIAGARFKANSPGRAMAEGVALVPEDRHEQGLALEASIAENSVITSLNRVSSRGWVSPHRERSFAQDLIARLHVVCRDPDQPIADLSGGNQQKVVLGRWLATGPRVLLLDEPTFGVDVGAQEEIHNLIRALASSGVAVLLISSDLIELLALSDRVLVVREGEIVADLADERMNEVEIMAAAVGSAVA